VKNAAGGFLVCALLLTVVWYVRFDATQGILLHKYKRRGP
jgi:hypothetical protein